MGESDENERSEGNGREMRMKDQREEKERKILKEDCNMRFI
jgi:hypothetical protein